MDHECTSKEAIHALDRRLVAVETKQGAMESDLSEIKQSLKDNKIFTMGIMATSLISAIGVIISLIGG